MRFNAESSMARKNSVVEWAGKPQRHFDAKARKKNAPRNGGGPRAPPREGLPYLVGRKINEWGWGSGEKTFGGWGIAIKRLAFWGRLVTGAWAVVVYSTQITTF